MKRFFKRIVSVMLVMILSLGCFSGCIETAEKAYMLKGEFFNAFINYFNYTPEGVTLEQMNDSDNYDVEAMTMETWGLLDRDDANKKLTKPITKEIAVIACLNEVYLKKTGNIDDIKDADLCDHPQLVADAIATGITELDNGYFNGDEKLTYEECQILLENTMNAKVDSQIAEEDSSISYAPVENSVSFSAYDLGENDFIRVEGYIDGSPEPKEAIELCDSNALIGEKKNTRNLALIDSEDNEVKNVDEKLGSFFVFVSDEVYNRIFSKARVGDYVIYTGDEYLPHLSAGAHLEQIKKPILSSNRVVTEPFAGNYVSSEQKLGGYLVILQNIPPEEKVAKMNITTTEHITGVKFEKLEKKVADFKISVSPNKNGDSVTVTASKELKLSSNKYYNWRDATAHPQITFSATISDMYLTVQNVKGFFKSDEPDAYLKFQSKTTENVLLECGGLRLAPDDNRNGKFWNNLSRSRFTDGAGAESVKIAKGRVSIYGIHIEIGVYLNIALDGKVSITFTQESCGFEIKKVWNDKTQRYDVKCSALEAINSEEIEAELNLDIGIQAKASVGFLVVENVLSGYIQFGASINAIFSLYHNENGEFVFKGYGYADLLEASGAASKDGIGFCLDVKGHLYLKGGLLGDNLIAKVSSKSPFNYDLTSISFDFVGGENGCRWLPTFSLHVEETGIVDECRRAKSATSDAEVEDNVKAETDEKFVLNTTKVHMTDRTCSMVYIKGAPISEEKIEKKYINGIQVKSRNENIVEVSYNEKSKSIMLTTVGPGSTEVDVYLRKDKVSGKEYMQTFSVTVFDNPDIEYSSFTIGDFEDVNAIKI